MGKPLYLQPSPRGERSISVAAADAFVNAYRRAHPADEIKALNLFRTGLPPFDGMVVADVTETSCSVDRPPNTIPTRSFVTPRE